jgi:uncharacterized membrane protein HdeD (DUF308 family)
MADIPSIFSSWKFLLIVLGIIYVYLLFYDPKKAMLIAQAIFIAIWRLIAGLFKILSNLVSWLLRLFR